VFVFADDFRFEQPVVKSCVVILRRSVARVKTKTKKQQKNNFEICNTSMVVDILNGFDCPSRPSQGSPAPKRPCVQLPRASSHTPPVPPAVGIH
jgi:hypothetical protein